MRLRIALVSSLALVASACSTNDVAPLPPPPTVPRRVTTTTVPDTSAVALTPVSGATTTTVPPIPGGDATLKGIVVGPEGPVEGAIVQAERLVGDVVGRARVATGPDGTWDMADILGGRYRVRVWKPAPANLALVTPLVFFLEGRETKTLELGVQRFQGTSVAADVAPSPPPVKRRVAVVVQVTQASVDAEGIVQAQPVVGISVELFGPGAWTVLSSNPTTTAGDGRARFEARCEREGRQDLAVVVAGAESFPIDVAHCEAAEPPPTSSSSTTSTTASGSSTTSSSSSTTTTTTRRTGPPTTGAGNR